MNKTKFFDLEYHLENISTRESGYSADRQSANRTDILFGFDHDYGRMDESMESQFFLEIEFIADKFNLQVANAGWNDDYSLLATMLG